MPESRSNRRPASRQDRGPRIAAPGIYDIPLSLYLADPAPEPSLSAGIAHKLLERSPWHAYCAHPRLGRGADIDELSMLEFGRHALRQDYRRDAAIGTVFHADFLGNGAEYEVHDVPDWRGKRGELKDESLAAGKTPITIGDYETVQRMVDAAVAQLDAHEIGNPTNRPGKAEQTLLWQEGGVWCRACVDWLPDDEPVLYDLKSSACAHPDVWQRLVFNAGYDLSAAHYLRGSAALAAHGGYPDATYRFIVVERDPPYALSVIDLSPGALHMAEKRRAAAVNLWGECLRNNRFPGYPSRVATIDLPPYREAQQVEREIAGHYDPAMLEQLVEGFAP